MAYIKYPFRDIKVLAHTKYMKKYIIALYFNDETRKKKVLFLPQTNAETGIPPRRIANSMSSIFK